MVGDAEKLIDITVTPLRLISEEIKSNKIVTIHGDGKLRVFSADDGLCINVSSHSLTPDKIIGLVDNPAESRFLLCFSETIVYIVDSWTMRVVDSLTPTMESYSKIKKGVVNQEQELVLMDRQSKSYRINIK